MNRHTVTALGRAVVFIATLLWASAVGAQTAIQYFYDDLGRLIAVVDPSGDTAVYTYDAVGNILSIARHASSQVSIIRFSPATGPVGTVVTISGTGFSTTTGQDMVTFNGTAATVSTATATQLVVSVPSGATTGTIAVTAPGGSATSATSFTVTTGSGAPTITSFTPTIGVQGTAITVTGTQFDTTTANNHVSLNLTRAPVTPPVTSTSLSTAVPFGGTTGHLTEVTPAGQAVSTDFFFVAPGTYVAADVQSTGSVTAGGSRTVTISTAGKIGLVAFDGTAGQRVSLKMTSSTITSTDVTFFKPDGTALGSVVNFGTGGAYIDVMSLPTTGTYTVLVDPESTYTGSVTVNLYAVTDLTAAPSSGSAYNATFTTPGQNLRLSYMATAGQRLSVNVTAVSLSGGIGSNSYAISILNPDGSTLLGPTSYSGTSFTETSTSSTLSAGTYTVLIDPSSSATGTMTLTGYVFTDVSGSITPGTPLTFSTSTPGQNARYTFSGTAGQKVSLNMTSVTFTLVHLTLLNPDGSTLATTGSTSSGAFMEPATLGSTGTYTLFVDPSVQYTGSITIGLYVFSDVTGSLTFGTAYAVSIVAPGQNAALTFSGTSGQKVSVKITNVTLGSTTLVSVLKPDGSSLTSALYPYTTFIDATSLPTTGTYTVAIDPSVANTGNITVTLYDASDVTGTLTIGGSAVTVTLSNPGQNGVYTFSGTASQLVTVHVTSNTITTVVLTLKKPDGSTLTTKTGTTSSFDMTQQTLPTTGTYTILVNPSSTYTGSLHLSVTNP